MLVSDLWNHVLSYIPADGVSLVKRSPEDQHEVIVSFRRFIHQNGEVKSFLQTYVHLSILYFDTVISIKMNLLKQNLIGNPWGRTTLPPHEAIDDSCHAMQVISNQSKNLWDAYDDITVITTQQAPFLITFFNSRHFENSPECQQKVGYGYLRKRSKITAKSLPAKLTPQYTIARAISKNPVICALAEAKLAALLHQKQVPRKKSMTENAVLDSRSHCLI